MTAVTFATYAESAEELAHVALLAESIRTFGGRFNISSILVYTPHGQVSDAQKVLDTLGVAVVGCATPEKARDFYYAGKVFAAAEAEASVEGAADVLVWMDEDTIVLDEPEVFDLAGSMAFAYRPVMHNRSGSLYSEPPDAFWRRIYEVLEIPDTALFPMTTPADRQTIRAYFNAGLLVVRPERGILKRWAKDFQQLYSDSVLVDMCKNDRTKAIFLHQTALVGAVLNTLKRSEMAELPDSYNYPIFFEQQYDATRIFGSIDDVITLRYDVYFRNPDPQWAEKLQGPADRVAWLRRHLSKD